MGILNIPLGILNPPSGILNIPLGILNILPGILNIPQGILNVPEGILNIPQGILHPLGGSSIFYSTWGIRTDSSPNPTGSSSSMGRSSRGGDREPSRCGGPSPNPT